MSSIDLISQSLLYISLITFIIIRYKTLGREEYAGNTIKPTVGVITVGIIYGLIVLLNMWQSRDILILPLILLISTVIIIYSIIVNTQKSPLLLISDNEIEEFKIGSQETDMEIADLRINLHELYSNKLLTKTMMTLIMYTVLTFTIWGAIWRKNCIANDLLCNQYFVFTIVYMAFALYLLLDMLRNTQEFQWFNYKKQEKNDMIFNNNWILYSLIYAVYLVYILIISQSIRNTLRGTSMDLNFNFAGFVTFILIIIYFVHYIKLDNAYHDPINGCDCQTARISILQNNIKIFQLNCIILPIVTVLISVISSKPI